MKEQNMQERSEAKDAARYRALLESRTLQVHEFCPDGLVSVRLTAAEIDAAADEALKAQKH